MAFVLAMPKVESTQLFAFPGPMSNETTSFSVIAVFVSYSHPKDCHLHILGSPSTLIL